MKRSEMLAYAAWISICIVWGTTYLAIRIGVQELPPMLFAGLRWLAAALIFLFILFLRSKKIPPRKEIIHNAIVGTLLLGIGNGFVVIGEQWIPSGLTSLIITTLPFWMVAFDSMLPSGGKLNSKIISGMALGFIGVLLILWQDLGNLSDTSYLGGMLIITLGVISWTGGSVFTKYNKNKGNPFTGACIQMLTAGFLQTIIGASLGEFAVIHFTTNGVLALLYLIFFGSFLGYAAYIYAIDHLPVSLVSTYAFINPVIALLLGWLVLNEDLNLKIIAAAAVILGGVLLVKKGNVIQKRIKT